MSQDENRADEAAGEATSGAAPPAQAPAAAGRAWPRLIVVALVAAVLGALVTANWHDVSLYWIFGISTVPVGLVVAGAAALGFVLGVVFLWSAITRGE